MLEQASDLDQNPHDAEKSDRDVLKEEDSKKDKGE